jgi:hypothetical protein
LPHPQVVEVRRLAAERSSGRAVERSSGRAVERSSEGERRDPSAFGELLGRWTPTEEGIVPVARCRPDGIPEQVPDAFWAAS